jgi:hypothetical protein
MFAQNNVYTFSYAKRQWQDVAFRIEQERSELPTTSFLNASVVSGGFIIIIIGGVGLSP